MTHEEHVNLFLAILSAHKGLSRAISVADIAGRLGFEPGKNGERRVQYLYAGGLGEETRRSGSGRSTRVGVAVQG